MSIIEASSGTYSSRVDGTIVLRVEIEPRHRAEALALFGMPGTPMALAALKPQSSRDEPEDRPPEVEPEGRNRPFRGPLCSWTAIRCGEPSFCAWLETAHPALWQMHFQALGDAEEAAAASVRTLCQVESRTELDNDDEAAGRLHARVRKPYAAWLKANPK